MSASPAALACEAPQVAWVLLRAERFVDKAPPEVYATLLDEGLSHGSIRTLYPLLVRESEVRERRGQRRRGHDRTPELWATGPNQAWSWEITQRRDRSSGAMTPGLSSSTSTGMMWWVGWSPIARGRPGPQADAADV